MTIPVSPSISISPTTFSSVGETITATVDVLNRPAYHGHPSITGLTTITPKILCSRTPTGIIPFHIQVSASETTCNAGNAYRDLHYEWDFGDSAGTELFTDHATGAAHNVNVQYGPEAAYLYRTDGSYTVTLTVKGKDENGTIVTASTTTITVIGWHYYFLANATGGTFTLTYEGEETGTIAFDADYAAVQSALEALASLDATNVKTVKLYNSVQFIGSLSGTSYTFTIDGSGLTGTNGTPTIVTQRTSGTSASVTVNDMTGLSAQYFDVDYDGSNGASDGTITRPYTTAADVKAWFQGGSNRVCYLKRGTTMVFGGMAAGYFNTRRIVPYDAGANPILTLAGEQIVYDMRHSIASNTLGDDVFSEITFQQSSSTGTQFIFCFPSTNGAASNYYQHLPNVVFDSIDYINTDSTSRHFNVIQWYGAINAAGENKGRGSSGIAVWGGVLDSGNQAGQIIQTSFNEYFSVLGTSFLGGNGNITLDHHVYPTHQDHMSFKYVTFGTTVSKNNCININARYYMGVFDHILIDGCEFTGTQQAFDASNESSDYDPPNFGYVDNLLVQFSKLHCGQVGALSYGLLCANLHHIVIRYTDWWGHADATIRCMDVTKPTDFSIYHNRFSGAPVEIWAGQLAFFQHNVMENLAAGESCLKSFSSTTNVDIWDNCDFNTYYAPNSTSPIARNGTAFVTLATWQGLGNDANGTFSDPVWYDPTNGVFISSPITMLNWPSSYTTLEYSLNGGANWFAYTNHAELSLGASMAAKTTVLFRADTGDTSSNAIHGTTDADTVDTVQETFTAQLTSLTAGTVLVLQIWTRLVIRWHCHQRSEGKSTC